MAEASLDGVIRAALEQFSGELAVALPGKIETFDESKRTATIKPMISRRYRGATTPTELPVIQDVPVVEQRTQKAILSLPVTPGDPVLMVFSDRALNNWLGSQGITPSEPLDVRTHNITDAFAILGGWPTGKSGITPPSGTAAIQVASGTKLYLGNQNEDLLAILNDMMDIFARVSSGVMASYITHSHSSSGADPPSDSAAWSPEGFTTEIADLQTRLAEILS